MKLGFASSVELGEELDRWGVVTFDWGKRGAVTKTLGDLYREIEAGESKLRVRGERVRRWVRVVNIRVFYGDENGKWELREDRQEFVDGGLRRRGDMGVREKMKAGEGVVGAAKRALREELGVKGILDLRVGVARMEEKDSISYPGLPARYQFYDCEVCLTKDQYKEEGYVEVQGDITTYFKWVRVE